MTGAFVFDPFDYAVHADPYPFYRVLRRDHPVYFSEGAHCWVLSRHADVLEAMHRPDIFSSRAGNVINDSPEKVGRTVGSADPPRHGMLRALVNEGFNRKQARREAAQIAADVEELLAPLEGQAFDLVRDVTAPLSCAVMARLLGMEGADHRAFKRLIDVSLHRDPVTRERTAEGNQAQAALLGMVADAVAYRRVHPGEDFLSVLVAARVDGAALAPDEVVWMARAVLGAGFESTSSFLANGSLALIDHPEQWSRLEAAPDLLDGAIEEMLRYESPAQRFARILAVDHAIDGVRMRAGTKVLILYGSANRDEAVWDAPDVFDITRKPGRHLGFGHGIHFCAGAALAREVARAYFSRLPRLRRLESGPLEWAHSPTFRSLVSLKVLNG